MTGYDEARQWLAQNAPEWVILRSESTLRAGDFIGSPSITYVEVSLVRPDDRDVLLTGNGPTILDATRRAIGVWER